MKQQAESDMQSAERNAHFIKELAKACYVVRTIIDAFEECSGPYAEPFINAQLEGILGVYRKKEREQ